jgi:hypothetical protein
VNPASVKCEDGVTYYNGAYIDYGDYGEANAATTNRSVPQAVSFSMSSFSSVSSGLEGHPLQSITAEDEGADALMGLFGNIEPIATGLFTSTTTKIKTTNKTKTTTTIADLKLQSFEAQKAKAAREASVTLLLHYRYTVVTLLLHCCYTVATLLLHYFYTVV